MDEQPEKEYTVKEVLRYAKSHDCPQCGKKKCPRHSIYERKVQDLDWTKLRIKIGTYFCEKCNYYFKHQDDRIAKSNRRYTDRVIRLGMRLAAMNKHAAQVLLEEHGVTIYRNTPAKWLREAYNAKPLPGNDQRTDGSGVGKKDGSTVLREDVQSEDQDLQTPEGEA